MRKSCCLVKRVNFSINKDNMNVNMYTKESTGVTGSNRLYTIYYAALLLLTFFLSKPNAAYSTVFRYAYMIAVVAPLFVNRSYITFALTLFLGISQASFVPLLPTTSTYFLVLAVALSFIQVHITQNVLWYILGILYILCIELFSMNPYFECVIWATIAVLLSFSVNTIHDIKRMGLGFTLVSLVLCVLFLMYFDEFSDTYASIGYEEVERSSWINANVFGGVIGCGMTSAVFLLVSSKEWLANGWNKFICVVVLLLSIVVLILNASRGALSASVISSTILLLSSKIKKKYLLLIFLGLAIFVLILYNVGYFELLELRTLGEDNTTDTAGGRTEIWEAKLNAFANLPILQQLFGVGYDDCVNLGIYFDTHNDLVTALCGYGYVGFISFIALLVAPVFVARPDKRIVIIGLLVFLILECVVLSPILRGYFIFFIFYIMIVKYALITKNRQDYV